MISQSQCQSTYGNTINDSNFCVLTDDGTGVCSVSNTMCDEQFLCNKASFRRVTLADR